MLTFAEWISWLKPTWLIANTSCCSNHVPTIWVPCTSSRKNCWSSFINVIWLAVVRPGFPEGKTGIKAFSAGEFYWLIRFLKDNKLCVGEGGEPESLPSNSASDWRLLCQGTYSAIHKKLTKGNYQAQIVQSHWYEEVPQPCSNKLYLCICRLTITCDWLRV